MKGCSLSLPVGGVLSLNPMGSRHKWVMYLLKWESVLLCPWLCTCVLL